MPDFHIIARHYFLTYSQCNLSKETILSELKSKVDIKHFIIAQEKHKDEGLHLHCYIELHKRKNIRNARYFDIQNYHPKIEKVRNNLACKRYTMKDKNFIHNYDKVPFKNTWEDAIHYAETGDVITAIETIKQQEPKQYILYKDRIEKHLNELEPKPVHKHKEYKFKTNKQILNWNKNYKLKQSLWIVGKSGTGKTEYAKTLFENPLIVSHIDGLKDFKRNKHDGIIFDDMNFSHWPRESVIHLTDLENDRQINVKYGCVTIPRLTPRVFTSNKYIWPEDNTNAINRRVRPVGIKYDLRILPKQIKTKSKDDYGKDINTFKYNIPYNQDSLRASNVSGPLTKIHNDLNETQGMIYANTPKEWDDEIPKDFKIIPEKNEHFEHLNTIDKDFEKNTLIIKKKI